MDTQNPIKPLAQQGKEAVNRMADTVQDGIRATQRATNQVVDMAADTVDEAKSNVAPMLDKAGDHEQKLMQQDREKLNDASQIVREKANQATDVAVGFTKDEPVKAMLIAAAAGALLMGLVSMMARSRNRLLP